MKYINQIEPSFDIKEINSIRELINSGSWLTEFKKTREFENLICKFTKSKFCHIVNNGTISLSIALMALGIKSNDNVIIPNITMIATPNSVKLIGANPIFSDIDKETLCLDINKVEDIIKQKEIKAVVHVSLNGRCNDIEKLVKICKANNIYLLEDSAQSLGSFHNNKHLGTFGDIGSFSFSVPKIISTGQGGALITNNEELSNKIRKLKDFGRDKGGIDSHDVFGINSKFTDLQAVVGIEQMKKLKSRIIKKNEIWELYYKKLSKHENIHMIDYKKESIPMFVDIFIDNPKYLKMYLEQYDIGSRLIYPNCNGQKVYSEFNNLSFPVSEYYAKRGLWLPSSLNLTEKDIDRICGHILDFVNINTKKCLICKSQNLTEIIDLGMHPCADIFLKKEQFQYDIKYPLICNLCNECSNIQLKYITNSIRYNIVDYSYTSSNSNFSKKHWKNYALELQKKCKKEKPFIVEIGSNDGMLLQYIKEFITPDILGVDASEKMCEIANNNNIPTICEVFDSNTIKKIDKKADYVIANNVLNHSNDTTSFLQGIYDLLNNGGIFVFELPYWGESIKSNRIDQIYHEHVTYFTVKSAKHMLKKVGLYINDIKLVNYHGVSLKIYASKKLGSDEITRKINDMINNEINNNLFNYDFYKTFMKNYSLLKDTFILKIDNYNKQNIPIIAIGAAAKGNTFLNYCELTNKKIKFVTDTSPHKIEKYTPGSKIVIKPDEMIQQYDKVALIILSWNISHILKPKLLKLNSNIEFIDFIN
tara:strand:- start:2017 stop:4302 length:2286 start_codon:yes stop_codon:yes gene_type:complete